MPDTKALNVEELNKLTQTLSVYKAIENAGFAAAMIRDEWRKISKTTEELGSTKEGPPGESPHTRDARSVTAIFTAIPPEEDILTSFERIKEHKKIAAGLAREVGEEQGIIDYCRAMEDIAAEFINTLVIDHDLKSGKPCIRGMRITAFDILELISEGNTPEQILGEHADLKQSDISDCIQFGLKLAEATGSKPTE